MSNFVRKIKTLENQDLLIEKIVITPKPELSRFRNFEFSAKNELKKKLVDSVYEYYIWNRYRYSDSWAITLQIFSINKYFRLVGNFFPINYDFSYSVFLSFEPTRSACASVLFEYLFFQNETKKDLGQNFGSSGNFFLIIKFFWDILFGYLLNLNHPILNTPFFT